MALPRSTSPDRTILRRALRSNVEPLSDPGRLAPSMRLMLCLVFLGVGYASPSNADDASSAPAFKEGWSASQIDASTATCTSAIIEPAKRDYAAATARAGNANPKPFPEDDIRGSIVPMCHCLIVRAAQTWSLADFSTDTSAKTAPFIEEAMNGGRCKPEGVLGKMLPKQQP